MLQYILDGGFVMFPLVLLSVLALAVIIDRLRVFRLAEVDTAALRMQVGELLEDGRVDTALDTCREFKGPVAAVLLAGLDRYAKLTARGRSTAEIEMNVSKAMSDYAPHVIETLEKRLNLLTLIGSVSPLLGMTGTVTGMIASFNAMAGAGGLDAGGVAAGISEALITTAAGLLIAIPAVVAYNLLAKRIDKFTLQIEETMMELLTFIALSHEHPAAS
jgi:biopolymer transport protein ExbB/TolQ